ncbi:MAG: YkgJ family cysteine cluster protein [Methanolobus sp.]
MLSHYSCPSRCPAICCKLGDINLDEKDMELLKQASDQNTDKIDSCIENGEVRYKIHPPCPFLESERCTIYNSRPTVCRMFPFNICNKHDVLLLFPCDMGANIFEDYVGYAGKVLKHPIPAKTIEDFEKSHCSF